MNFNGVCHLLGHEVHLPVTTFLDNLCRHGLPKCRGVGYCQAIGFLQGFESIFNGLGPGSSRNSSCSLNGSIRGRI